MNELLLLLSVFTATIFGTVNETETTNDENISIENNEGPLENSGNGIPRIVVFMN